MKTILGTILALTLTAAPILAQTQQTPQTAPDPSASTQDPGQLDNTAKQDKIKADAASKKSKAAKKAANAQKNADKQQSKMTDAQQKAAAAHAANAATPAPQ